MAQAVASTTVTSKMTLTALQKNRELNTPYAKPLTVKVIKVSREGWIPHKTATGFSTIKLTTIVADSTTFVKCLVYGEQFQQIFTEGRTVAIRNYIYRENTLRVISKSQVLIHTDITVPPHILNEGIAAFGQPLSPVKKIDDVKKSPIKSKVSFVGKVTCDEAPRTITTRQGKQLDVRNIKVQDQSGEIMVALWKDSSSKHLNTGMDVIVKDGTLRYNETTGDYNVAVNDLDDIEVTYIAVELTKKHLLITGANQEQNILTLIDSNDEWFNVERQIVFSTLTVQNLEEFLDLLPVTLSFSYMGEDIVGCKAWFTQPSRWATPLTQIMTRLSLGSIRTKYGQVDFFILAVMTNNTTTITATPDTCTVWQRYTNYLKELEKTINLLARFISDRITEKGVSNDYNVFSF